MIEPKCPLDGGNLVESEGSSSCESCGASFPMIEIAEGRKGADFRCLDIPQDVTMTFAIPQEPLTSVTVDKFGIATEIDFPHMPREKIRKLYGTKMQKEVHYYIDALLKNVGSDATILDLGCGNGGNKRYLESIGFHNIISVDFMAPGAEFLVDVHRLPFASESFDLILTTATLEHFYNPFIAFKEMNRVLRTGGMLIASGSFWESWHGNSCFHFTPGGIDLLCRSTDLKLSDLWSGWGFIPSISSHAFGLARLKRFTYFLQRIFDFGYSLRYSREAAKKHRFKTSGSFGLFAVKTKGTLPP